MTKVKQIPSFVVLLTFLQKLPPLVLVLGRDWSWMIDAGRSLMLLAIAVVVLSPPPLPSLLILLLLLPLLLAPIVPVIVCDNPAGEGEAIPLL